MSTTPIERELPLARAAMLLAVLLVLQVVSIPTSAAADSRDPWVSGAGTLELLDETGSVTLVRSVEMWRDPKGAYRVVVASLDGYSAREEVSSDGCNRSQRVLVTRPSGEMTATIVDGSAHFAIFTPSDAREAGWTVHAEAYGLMTAGQLTMGDRPLARYEMALTPIEADRGLLRIDLPSGVKYENGKLKGEPQPDPGLITPQASGSSSQTFSVLGLGPCVYGYNNRNNVSNFFTANTQLRSVCTYVDVSAWEGGLDGSGACWGDWVAGGPTSSSYSSVTGYWDPPAGEYMCSNHAGWRHDWVLLVAWRGLQAAVSG